MSSQDLRERFLATPLVTRSLAASTWAALILNIVTAGGFGDLICASPHDILRRGQVWRLVTSLFYVPGVFSALFLSFALYRLCSAWELERGSLRLVSYFVVGAVGTNLGTTCFALALSPIAPHLMAHQFVCAPGIQSALFVVFARIALAYEGPGVDIFGVMTVPRKRIPLLLFVAFVLFGAHPAEALAALAVSALWSRGRLTRIALTDTDLRGMEQSRALVNVVRARGYVSCADAGGAGLPVAAARTSGSPPAASRTFAQHVRDHAFSLSSLESGERSGARRDGRVPAFEEGGGRGRVLGAEGGGGVSPPSEYVQGTYVREFASPERSRRRAVTGTEEPASSPRAGRVGDVDGIWGGGGGPGALDPRRERQNVHLQRFQRAQHVSSGNQSLSETRDDAMAAPAPVSAPESEPNSEVPRRAEESREARAAALASAHERRLKEQQAREVVDASNARSA